MTISTKLAILSSLVLAAGCSDEFQGRQATYGTAPYGTAGNYTYGSTSGTYGSSGAYSTTQDMSASDRALENSVRDQLNHYGELASAAPNVQIMARNGAITLNGAVPTERDRQMIDAMVRNTAGVISLNDQLQVNYTPTGSASGTYNQPVQGYATSPTAAQPAIDPNSPTPIVTADSLNLRIQTATDNDRQVADRIGDALRNETVLPTLVPNVNISVNNGRVTLRGIVQSESQRRTIISTVQHVPGVATVYDELRLR